MLKKPLLTSWTSGGALRMTVALEAAFLAHSETANQSYGPVMF